MGDETEVLVVGAGPTGLLLAGDLARAGVACTVLERRREESNLTRAFAVHARTLELLDARGIGDELAATGEQVSSLRVFGRLDVDLSRLPSRYPYVLVTPQYTTERVLRDRALAMGAEIVRDAEVVGVSRGTNGVQVEVTGGDGTRSTWAAAYAVGTDGVGSTIRQALDLPFPGESAVQSVMLADVRLGAPPAEVLTADATEDGFAFLAPFGDGWYRVIAWNRHRQFPDAAPVDLEEIQAISHAVLGTDFGMHDPRWTSRFHSDERQVPRYRTGRVFLAGDAAHVHSPVGGQGMNVGLGDAANLGWKLAAAVRGWAPDGLLDTYQSERHPVGRAVLRGSGVMLRIAMGQSSVARLARFLLKEVVGPLGLVPPPAARAVSGLAVSYPSPGGRSRLIGKRAPDREVALTDGTPSRLYEAMRDGRFVVVLDEQGSGVTTGWRDRVVAVATDEAAAAMLVRPDGYVAWASDDTNPAAREAGLRDALTDWCGRPTGP